MTRLLKLYKKYAMIINYLIVGGLTTLINLVTYFILRHFGFGLAFATTTGNILSIIFAFFTNKSLVFHSAYDSRKKFWFELISFFLLRGISLVLDNVITIVGIQVLHGNELLVKLVDQVIIIVANYLFSKLIFLRSHD